MSIDIIDRLLYTGLAIIIAILCAIFVYTILARGEMTPRRHQRLRYRIVYVFVVVICVVMVKVWIDNFTHLFTMLGLVAAGLVVANKESIMNLTGWFIINWRNLFAEGDHIAVLNYVGYVDNLGPLYFKIYEVDMETNNITGRTIRIPNGVIINNSVANYSASNQLAQASINVPVGFGTDLEKVQAICLERLNEVLTHQYRKLPLSEMLIWRRYHKSLAHLMSEYPVVRWQLDAEHKRVNIILHFYCLSSDQFKLKNAFWQSLLLQSQSDTLLNNALKGIET